MPARRPVATGAVLAGLVAAVGCGGEAAVPGTLTVAEDQAPPILNVMLAQGATAVGQRVVANVQQNLLTADDRGRYVPQLAMRVPSADDVRTGPLRVTYRLRAGARWSDGRPVTAADAVFTWRVMTAPRNQVASRAGWERIASIRPGVTATGARCAPRRCFTVRFRGDYAPWREVFSVSGGAYLLPRHALRGRDFNTVWNRRGPLGSGPYTVERFTPGESAVLRRDPGYWGEPTGPGSPIERIVFRFLDSPGGALTALDAGEADLVSPPPDPDLLARAHGIDGVTVTSVPSVFWELLLVNAGDGRLADVRVRRALAHAVDRGEVARRLLGADVPVLQSPLRPFQPGHLPVFGRYAYDPARAAALLEAAGWRRDGSGVFARDGRRLELTVATPAGNELRRRTVRLLAARARAAGVVLRYRPEPPDRLYGRTLPRGDFDLALLAYGGSLDPSLTGTFASAQIPSEANGGTGQNYGRWRNARADALMRRSDAAVAPARRGRLLGALQRVVAEDVPVIPLYQQPNTAAHVAALTGVRVNPTQVELFWNSARWRLGGRGAP